MIGLRNLVIHEYFGVDLKTTWNILANDIPKLKESVTILIKKSFNPIFHSFISANEYYINYQFQLSKPKKSLQR